MDQKIIVIDYNLGNLFSVNQALKNIGLQPKISSNPNDIADADAILLPGVGAFNEAMINLEKMQLIKPIQEFVRKGKPFMGICLGLQLLLSESEEFGSAKGLNLIKGTVKRFTNTNHSGLNRLKVPQIAWNSIHQPNPEAWINTPLQDVKEGENMYFVHSYYIKPDDESIVLSHTTYGSSKYVSSILKDNIFACQFHPEKSAEMGISIYKQWAVQNNLNKL
jgi:glutamine amidotransferase